MTPESHKTIHSLVPVYASLSRIQKLAVDGFRGGAYINYQEIRTEAESGMAELMMLEKQLAGEGQNRRKYEQTAIR